MQLEEKCPYKTCGSTYSVVPEIGKGYYWTYGYRDRFAVVIYDMSFYTTIEPIYEHPAFYTIGSYIISNQIDSSSRILLSYSRPKEVWKEIIGKEYSGNGISIALSESFAKEIACLFDITMEELVKRCFCLDGTIKLPEADIIFRQLQLYAPTEQFAHHYYESKLLELLIILCQRHETPCPVKNTISEKEAEGLSRVTDYIALHYMEAIDLRILSATAYMGRTKLTQSFKQMYGITITQYVRQLRVRHAKSLLKKSHLSLGEIASQVGYQTQGSFTDLFKEATGLTPREYRYLFCNKSL